MQTYPPTPPPMSGNAYRASCALIDVLRRQFCDVQHHDICTTVADLLKAYDKEGHSELAARDAIVSLLNQGILLADSAYGSILETSIVDGEGNNPQPSVSTITKSSFKQIKIRIGERFSDWAKHNPSDELNRTLQLLKKPQARAIVQHLWDGQRHRISSLPASAFDKPRPKDDAIRKAIDRVINRFVEEGLRYEIRRDGQVLQLRDFPKI